MFETAFTSFATFIATIGPVEAAMIFAALTGRFSRPERSVIAMKASGIATLVLLFFALVGQHLLKALGVSFAALEVAGGIILFLLAMEMIFHQSSGAVSLNEHESLEAERQDDIAVFPLATPLLAGPGAISASIMLMANTKGDLLMELAVIFALLVVMGMTLMLFFVGQELHRWIGVTPQKVLVRVMGILLAALAIQSVFDGIAAAGVFRSH